jgi:hypothetical protein
MFTRWCTDLAPNAVLPGPAGPAGSSWADALAAIERRRGQHAVIGVSKASPRPGEVNTALLRCVRHQRS